MVCPSFRVSFYCLINHHHINLHRNHHVLVRCWQSCRSFDNTVVFILGNVHVEFCFVLKIQGWGDQILHQHNIVHNHIHEDTPIHINTHQYTSININTHDDTSSHINTNQYTLVIISTNECTKININAYQDTSVHMITYQYKSIYISTH